MAKLGWKELTGSANEATYCSATFQKGGFVVSVICYAKSDPAKKGAADVYLSNFGNVPISKIPAVKGAKSQSPTALNAVYTTTLKSAEAATATRKLLVDAGWEPYGETKLAPDSEILTFKRNAIQLRAHLPEDQAKQVMIIYSASLMISFELTPERLVSTRHARIWDKSRIVSNFVCDPRRDYVDSRKDVPKHVYG